MMLFVVADFVIDDRGVRIITVCRCRPVDNISIVLRHPLRGSGGIRGSPAPSNDATAGWPEQWESVEGKKV
jgi:hypothetical protein